MIDLLQYEEKLKQIALQICNNYHTAEDIVQDTYIEALINGVGSDEQLFNLCIQLANSKKSKELNSIVKARPGRSLRGDQGSDDFVINNYADSTLSEPTLEEKISEINSDSQRKKYIAFELARAYARGLGLRSSTEWKYIYDAGKIPPNIPKSPKGTYYKEWRGWIDFLDVRWLTFEEARNYVVTVLVPKGIKSKERFVEYAQSGNLIKNIPHHPQIAYGDQWQGWAYWFKNEKALLLQGRKILSYEGARDYVQNYMVPLGIDSASKYIKYIDPPECLPKKITFYYKNRGWISSSHFFNTNKIKVGTKRTYEDYKTVREWCRLNLRPHGIDSESKFRAYLRSEFPEAPAWPAEFPRSVYAHFKKRKQWMSFRDLLGNIRYRKSGKTIWPFDKARDWAVKNLSHIDLLTTSSWNAYAKGTLPLYDLPEYPLKMPMQPRTFYGRRNEWKGWPYFFNRLNQKGAAFKRFIKLKADRAKETKRKTLRNLKKKESLTSRGILIQNNEVILRTDKPLTGKMLRRLLKETKK